MQVQSSSNIKFYKFLDKSYTCTRSLYLLDIVYTEHEKFFNSANASKSLILLTYIHYDISLAATLFFCGR